jgi:crossover junction endodeoxyribonuclease RuvC
MAYIGIDPGLSGGIASIENDGEVHTVPMPIMGSGKDRAIDCVELVEWIIGPFSNQQPIMVVVEKVHAMPSQGVTSTFTFGKGYGMILGALAACRLPHMLVTPQAWKKAILSGVGAKDKKAAIQWCAQAYPQANLLATARSRVPHDGIADALCMAEYGRRLRG